ncbi:hypothetical protein LOK49_LG03G01579 [Camellia lanceoleosa]|uniref:Uncharacterized protein n=1 Tax=Camellia lanceoleosa TaxID=1840588 RepID=A0ACC0I8A7_9ERIC|nr:hypothetical protein LOK49_LG03G01579 [Camellia lanceoleosa]
MSREMICGKNQHKSIDNNNGSRRSKAIWVPRFLIEFMSSGAKVFRFSHRRGLRGFGGGVPGGGRRNGFGMIGGSGWVVGVRVRVCRTLLLGGGVVGVHWIGVVAARASVPIWRGGFLEEKTVTE